jgi:hypothetical protein
MIQVSEEQFNAEADMMQVSEEHFHAKADIVDGLFPVSHGNGLVVFYYPNGERFGKMLGGNLWYLVK